MGRHFVRPEQRNTAVPPTKRPVGRQPLASAGAMREPKSTISNVPSAIPSAIDKRDNDLFFMVINYTWIDFIITTETDDL